MRSSSFRSRTASRIFAVIGLLAAGGIISARAQEASRTVEEIYQFDDKGNATIEFKFQLSASRWAQWKDQFGDHPDILLRNLKYELAAAVIDDFSLEKDDVHRRAVAKIKARALAQYRSGGQFEIQVPKEMNLVAGSGTEWVFTNSSLEDGGIVNVTYRGELPPKAKDAHLTTGGDYNLLVYSLDVAPPKSKTLLYVGSLLVVLGAGLGVGSIFSSGKSTPSAAG
ncbi:MAG: hypothetical protein ACREIF_14785 [Chthoniobacterales bacterium]